MKKIALILGSLLIMCAVSVNAQEKTGSKPTKSATHMNSKKTVHKKSAGNYHMNNKSVQQGKSTSQPMEDNSKVKSKGKPVY